MKSPSNNKFKQYHLLNKIALSLLAFLIYSFNVNGQINQYFTDTLNKALKEQADLYDMKGIAAAVVFPDGSVWSGEEGHYGTDELVPGLLYEMGSNTKTMVAAVILLLEEDNKLSINDTLYKYLNYVDDVPYGITLKQLLNHTSGIFSYTTHPDFATEVFNDVNKFWEIDTILANFLAPPVFTAGSSWEYSNTNYLLLGKVIEAVEGKEFHVVLKERLFSPYNLNHSFLEEYDSYTDTKVGTWLTNGTYFGPGFTSFLSSAWSAGALVSTTVDLASWAYQLYRGDILEDTSLTKMKDGVNLGGNTKYGLGMFETTYNGDVFLGHGGTTLQNSTMSYNVNQDYSVVTVGIDQDKQGEPSNIQIAIIDIINFKLSHIVAGNPENQAPAQINIYPNPSGSYVHVKSNLALKGNTTLNIYNMNGQLIKKMENIPGDLLIDKSSLGSGMFFLHLTGENGHSEKGTLIFQ